MAAKPDNPIYCAVDTNSLEAADHLAHELSGRVGGLKLGLEFFSAHGPAGLDRLRAHGLPIFLDLKLHDIPNTVAGAVRALVPLGVRFLTLHASGGGAMMRAALAAARDTAETLSVPRPKLLAVTVLTSLDQEDLRQMGVDGGGPHAQVDRLAFLALDSGMDGLVCSALEIGHVRSRFGTDPILMVPGIRPEGGDADDQKRVTTPQRALADGADFLVIGRPITRATDPGQAADRILLELAPGSRGA